MDALRAFHRARRGKGPRRVRANEPHVDFPSNKVTNTKFTVLTFLPKTLGQQFSKPMQCYFLLIAILQLNPTLTPVNPITTWAPLILVTLVSMGRELWDDLARARQDRAANSRDFLVMDSLSSRRPRAVRSADIRVGQLVRVAVDEEVPCDLVLVALAPGQNVCYVQTTNLDGEADLKERKAPAETATLSEDRLHDLDAVYACPPPSGDIFHFDATLTLGDGAGAAHSRGSRRVALSSDHVVLQGTVLRKTPWVWGVAVYTGNETRLSSNKSVPPFKFPAAERFVNGVSVAIFAFQLLLAASFGGAGILWQRNLGVDLPYLLYDREEAQGLDSPILVFPLRFLLLMSLMIPISLAVTLDMLRILYAA